MSKRTPMDKEQLRERRNRLLENAAAAELSITEGVREMRIIAGMTQEEFARHRGVSARVIKAIEREQGNPTVTTLNRIGQFFGLEVAFVPIGRKLATERLPNAVRTTLPAPLSPADIQTMNPATALASIDEVIESRASVLASMGQQLAEARNTLASQMELLGTLREKIAATASPPVPNGPAPEQISETSTTGHAPPRKRRKPSAQ